MKNLCGESIHVVVVLLAIDGPFPERDPNAGVAAPLGVQLRSVTRAGFVGQDAESGGLATLSRVQTIP
jgi:hypothetical protein